MAKENDGYIVELYGADDEPSAAGRAEYIEERGSGLECVVIPGGDIPGTLAQVSGPSEEVCRRLEKWINGLGGA